MGIQKKHGFTALLLICVMLITPACVQLVGDNAQGQASSQLITSTFTPIPPTSTSTPTEEAEDVPISELSTETSTPTDTPSPTATETSTPQSVAQAGDEGQLFPTETDDPFEVQATSIVETATAQVLILTQEALGVTDTPSPTVIVPTQDLGSGGGDTGVVISGADCIHEVRGGETMFQLSRYYGIPVADIATRNGVVNPDLISIGQKFTITGCGTNNVLPPPTSVPSLTPTQFLLDSVQGTGGSNLGQGGGATTTTGVTTTVGCQAQYTVQQYDNLFQLSVRYGVSVQSIANANGITNLNYIDMGQVLCIPNA
ncbi:MAG: LysM peptidoglycan-binding domain-containing protein [Chloroflexota bacterium]